MTHIHRYGYKKGEKGALLGIFGNLILFAIKFAAGIAGRSQAMIADSFHTASDVLSSVVVLVGFKIAKKPADSHHPFGHGRAESIAAKLVSIILLFVSLKLIYDSVRILVAGEQYTPGMIALAAACFSIIVKEILYRRVVAMSREIKSTSLMADAYHHRSDAFSSIAALVGIAGSRLGWTFMDPLAGIVVALFIFKIGIQMFHTAYDELMDAAPPEELRSAIEKTTSSCSGVEKVKKIMVRKSGIELFIELIIGVDKNKTVEEGHLITIRIKREILKNIPNAREIIVHVEPV